ncbi:MAG: tetratricopeptide repeat protein [Myxococcota bacterium]
MYISVKLTYWGLAEKRNSCDFAQMNRMWIKKNQSILATVAVLFAVIVCGIPVWIHLAEKKNEVASESYYRALAAIKKDDPESLKTAQAALNQIAVKDDSKVSRLASLASAKISLQLGDAGAAAKIYEMLLTKLSPKDALRPLALVGLKTSYDVLGQSEKSKNIQAELASLGFLKAK